MSSKMVLEGMERKRLKYDRRVFFGKDTYNKDIRGGFIGVKFVEDEDEDED